MLFRYWRGLLVALSWIASPFIWAWLNVGPEQCAIDECAPHAWWDMPIFLLEVFVPALLATLVWYQWRRYRVRRRVRRLSHRSSSRRSTCASSASSLSSQA
jgi:hypothetical protein